MLSELEENNIRRNLLSNVLECCNSAQIQCEQRSSAYHPIRHPKSDATLNDFHLLNYHLKGCLIRCTDVLCSTVKTEDLVFSDPQHESWLEMGRLFKDGNCTP